MTREELLEARDRVRRQIEILEAPPLNSYRSLGPPPLSGGGTAHKNQLLGQMKAILSEIESELGDGHADPGEE
jgi:hypothetical protein